MFLRGILGLLIILSVPQTAFCEGSCIVSIQKVELKNQAGSWVTVWEPDRQVDLATEAPSASFVNNGRVPADKYVNFKLTLCDGIQVTQPYFLSGFADFEEALEVKKTSFVGVEFKPDFKPELVCPDGVSKKILSASVTVDSTTRTLVDTSLILEK